MSNTSGSFKKATYAKCLDTHHKNIIDSGKSEKKGEFLKCMDTHHHNIIDSGESEQKRENFYPIIDKDYLT